MTIADVMADAVNFMTNSDYWTPPAELSRVASELPNFGDTTAAAMVIGFIVALAVVGWVIPYGRIHHGTVLSDGRHMTYKINGLMLFNFTLIVWAVCVYMELTTATVVYRHMSGVFTYTNAVALLMSVFLYIKGCVSGTDGAQQHAAVTGLAPLQRLTAFWEGTQLTPHLFGINLKFFWLRPSMMAWGLINLSMLARHVELSETGSISTAMALYQLFTMMYIVDYFFLEAKMTSTWDIIAEHFGFMLVWGDLVFIPFWFSVQTYVLLSSTMKPMPLWYNGLNVLVFVVGYIIFRGTNSQKDAFKLHGANAIIWGRPAETVGGRLLVSGYWSWARHSNYLGDILLAIAYSMPCGINTVWGWLYTIYLTLLLVQRERRDERRCARKYGKVWQRYCQRVPYRILPYVY